MTSHEAIPSSRSELKFEIEESQTAAIREYLRAHLRPDPNCWEGSYAVCSAYLDSEDRLLYEQTNQGIRNRYKLRVRVYDDDPEHPAFLEIKGRDGNAICKQRARVDRTLAAAALSGAPVSMTQSTYRSSDRSDWQAFQEFCRLRDRIGAVGSTYVSYQREAYISPGKSGCRATFDRQLMACPYRASKEFSIPDQWVEACDKNIVVFELKFSDRCPNWMKELVRTFNLVSGPFPKYVTCRDSLRTADAYDARRDSGHALSASWHEIQHQIDSTGRLS